MENPPYKEIKGNLSTTNCLQNHALQSGADSEGMQSIIIPFTIRTSLLLELADIVPCIRQPVK